MSKKTAKTRQTKTAKKKPSKKLSSKQLKKVAGGRSHSDIPIII